MGEWDRLLAKEAEAIASPEGILSRTGGEMEKD